MADMKEMLKQIRERTTPEQKKYVENNIEIVDYIYELLAAKKMKPVDLKYFCRLTNGNSQIRKMF
nr:hypothetical protein [Bacteroidota bacterium]